MSLEQLSKTVDFVQATTPSNANDGETYLDTSQSPPQLKVFDSSAGAFIRPRSIQNLDAPVSNAGATQSDIETGAEGALEQDIANLSPASNSVAANLDGGVASVDWSSKEPKSTSVINVTAAASGSGGPITQILSVSGSGYLISAIGSLAQINGSCDLQIEIDGTQIFSRTFEDGAEGFGEIGFDGTDPRPVVHFDGLHRFTSGFALKFENTSPFDVDGAVGVEHVLD